MLNGNYTKYDLTIKKAFENLNKKDLQQSLYKLNEKTEIQKETGVYYTPGDVCKYIVWNAIITKIDQENSKTYREENALQYIVGKDQKLIDKILFEFKFIDPICGSAECLINLFKIKYDLLIKTHKNITDSDIYILAKLFMGMIFKKIQQI